MPNLSTKMNENCQMKKKNNNSNSNNINKPIERQKWKRKTSLQCTHRHCNWVTTQSIEKRIHSLWLLHFISVFATQFSHHNKLQLSTALTLKINRKNNSKTTLTAISRMEIETTFPTKKTFWGYFANEFRGEFAFARCIVCRYNEATLRLFK